MGPHDRLDDGQVERSARAARLEQRSEREAMEDAVAEHQASTRDLSTLLAHLGTQGTELMIDMPDRQLVGRVTHVGAQLVSIENVGSERFDLALWAIAGCRLLRTAPRPTTVTSGHPGTVLARLREAHATGQPVTVARRFGPPMGGRLQACSETHVEGIDHNGSYWIVPLPMVTWITTIQG